MCKISKIILPHTSYDISTIINVRNMKFHTLLHHCFIQRCVKFHAPNMFCRNRIIVCIGSVREKNEGSISICKLSKIILLPIYHMIYQQPTTFETWNFTHYCINVYFNSVSNFMLQICAVVIISLLVWAQ